MPFDMDTGQKHKRNDSDGHTDFVFSFRSERDKVPQDTSPSNTFFAGPQRSNDAPERKQQDTSCGFKNLPGRDDIPIPVSSNIVVSDNSSCPSMYPPETQHNPQTEQIQSTIPYSGSLNTHVSVRPRVHRRGEARAAYESIHFPWKLIIPLLLLIGVFTAMYVFRDEITSFLSQALSWAIVLIIIIGMIRMSFDKGKK